MERSNSVSVAIPLYGVFDQERVHLVLESMVLQRDISLEVVVAEQSEMPSLVEKDLPPLVKYIHIPISNKKGEFFRPGLIRNLSVKNCTNPIIYSSDGDVIFQNPDFLRESIELLGGLHGAIMLRPPIRRLPVECFGEFKEDFEAEGIEFALKELDRTQPYIANTNLNKVVMRIFKKYESGRMKTFLYTEGDYEAYVKNLAKGHEPFYSTLETHAGGTLMLKSQFEEVGGFCLRFAGWGCQDADLQWKLKESFGFLQFPDESKFEVLHLDHSKTYFSREQWMENREIQRLRRESGIEFSISEDIATYNG